MLEFLVIFLLAFGSGKHFEQRCVDAGLSVEACRTAIADNKREAKKMVREARREARAVRNRV